MQRYRKVRNKLAEFQYFVDLWCEFIPMRIIKRRGYTVKIVTSFFPFKELV